MKALGLTVGEALRGVVAIGLIALAMGVIAPLSMFAALLLVAVAILLVVVGKGSPLQARGDSQHPHTP